MQIGKDKFIRETQFYSEINLELIFFVKRGPIKSNEKEMLKFYRFLWFN